MTEPHGPIDSVVLVSFGGPEGPDDVLPFLENVTGGRNVPRERLAAVAEQYSLFDGVSPINQHNRDLIVALEQRLKRSDIELPVYWGNRNWQPLLSDTVTAMANAGHRHALAIVTSAFGSYSGCRQYRDDLALAAANVPDPIAFTKAPLYWNHPGFLTAFADRIASALADVDPSQRSTTRLIFTAHSIPEAWVDASPYVLQLRSAAAYLAGNAEADLEWDLVYQSRSGSPRDPWLGPDIVDHLKDVASAGVETVVVVPLGFVSDHMEVKFDLDVQAHEAADALGIAMVRAGTPGTHPAFVDALCTLVEEETRSVVPLRAINEVWPRTCSTTCCVIGPGAATPRP